ncbi:hypothetical protein [Hymenobacter sp. DG01]|uniref:hypothetical protein n=1 Tax=Hymenobacter sp. DG01 TaxID=2584940 RepID=UPI001121859D|nr:hypothetical protein [Hymenobacter sp. DG01]
MKALSSYFRTLTLLLLVAASAPAAKAAGQPAEAATPGSVEQRAGSLTRYLTQALDLSKAQQKAVRKSVRQYVREQEVLAVKPGLVAADTDARLLSGRTMAEVDNEFDTALARVLTPGQYSAYSWLREHQPESRR